MRARAPPRAAAGADRRPRGPASRQARARARCAPPATGPPGRRRGSSGRAAPSGKTSRTVGRAGGARRRERQGHEERRLLLSAGRPISAKACAEELDPERHQRVAAPALAHPGATTPPVSGGGGRARAAPRPGGPARPSPRRWPGRRREPGVVLAQDEPVELVGGELSRGGGRRGAGQLHRGGAHDGGGVGRDLERDGDVGERGAEREAQPRRIEPQEAGQVRAGGGEELETAGGDRTSARCLATR